MSCARGCCATQAEHYRSLHVAASNRKQMTKVTTERDPAVGRVDVTEHWHDRQDVTVRPRTIHTNIEELRRGAK